MSSNDPQLSTPIRTPDSPPSINQDRHVTWDSSTGLPPPSAASGNDFSTKVLDPPQVALTPHMPSVRSYVPVEPPSGTIANGSVNAEIDTSDPATTAAATLSVAPPPPIASPGVGIKTSPPLRPLPTSNATATMALPLSPSPPPPPSPPTSIPGTGGSERKRENCPRETIGSRLLDATFGGISFLIIFVAFFLYWMSQRIDFWTLSMGADRELRALPEYMTFSSIFIILVMGLGLIALLLRSRTIVWVYLACLLAIYIGQSVETYRIGRHLHAYLRTLTFSWDSLSSTMRTEIQIFGQCCGYYDPFDRPGGFCPESTFVGCRYRLKELEAEIRHLANDALFISLMLIGVLMGLLILITRKRE